MTSAMDRKGRVSIITKSTGILSEHCRRPFHPSKRKTGAFENDIPPFQNDKLRNKKQLQLVHGSTICCFVPRSIDEGQPWPIQTHSFAHLRREDIGYQLANSCAFFEANSDPES